MENAQYIAVWAAIIMGAGNGIALIKFVWSIGATLNKAEAAERIATSALVKSDLVSSQLAEHKVETAKDVARAEAAFTTAIHNLTATLNTRLDAMNLRFDRMMSLIVEQKSSD